MNYIQDKAKALLKAIKTGIGVIFNSSSPLYKLDKKTGKKTHKFNNKTGEWDKLE